MNKAEQKEYFLKIADLVKKTGELYSKLIQREGNSDDLIEKILEYETKGDNYQNILDDHFKNQRNIPYLALDRAKLLARMDDILDDMALAARVYEAYGKALPEDFPQKIADYANDLNEISIKFSDAVEVIYSSFNDALDLCKEIEGIRDEMMEISFDIEREYFNESDKTGWKSFIAVEQNLRKSMKAVEQVKQASEILELMAMKYD